ncbi:hypothetical protein [Halobacteriovorax sp. RT-2-6]|uniref:hypothetical protein n=1 Tax=unclassified Halobacteriovorax TaxID=2639665 RepID=UPI00399C25B6
MIIRFICIFISLLVANAYALTGGDIVTLKPKKFDLRETFELHKKFVPPIAYQGEVETDEIVLASSGVQKGAKVSGNIKESDDLVFFSYGAQDAKKDATAKTPQFKAPIVKGVSKQVLGPKNYKPVIDFSSFIQSAARKKKAVSNFKVKLREFGEKGISKNNLTDFDLVPTYNLNELFTDSGTGEVLIPISSDDSFSTFRGSIAARDIIRTNFELSARSETTFDIPVINSDYLRKILERNKVKEHSGAHILVDLGDKIDTSTFMGSFKKKVYLDRNFKEVDPGDSFVYELYLDVELGNHLIKYMDFKGKVAQKIIHLVQDEITYEAPYLLDAKAINFSIYEENLAAKTLQSMNLNDSDIRYFNREITASKVGLNRYKILTPLRDASFKHYIEVGKETSVFVGFNDIKKVVIPSIEYIDYLKELFQNRADNGACVIQVNLNKPLVSFEAYISSISPSGSYDFYYMDKDGTVSAEITGLTEKVFIISHDYGILNTKIDSGEGSIQYTQSFCTEGLYIIENI